MDGTLVFLGKQSRNWRFVTLTEGYGGTNIPHCHFRLSLLVFPLIGLSHKQNWMVKPEIFAGNCNSGSITAEGHTGRILTYCGVSLCVIHLLVARHIIGQALAVLVRSADILCVNTLCADLTACLLWTRTRISSKREYELSRCLKCDPLSGCTIHLPRGSGCAYRIANILCASVASRLFKRSLL